MKVQFARLAFALALFVGTEAAAQRVPMTAIDLLEVPVLTDPRLSPDGDRVLFVLAEADWEKNERVSHIWRAGVRCRGSRAAHARDERRVEPKVVARRRVDRFRRRAREGDEAAQLYRLSAAGGEAERLTSHETSVSEPLVLAGREARLLPRRGLRRRKRRKSREKLEDDVFAFDENWKHRRLWAPVARRKDDSPSHRGRLHRTRVSALSGRNEGRAPSRAFASSRCTRPRGRSTS